jgi:chitinase
MARNVIYFNNTDNQIPLAGIANLPYTDVILAFLVVDGNLNVHAEGGAFDSHLQSNMRALQNAGKNVLVSFGWDRITFPSSDWQRCAQNAQNVQTVVTNIASFVISNGFNGVDIDYEDNNGFTGEYDGVTFLSQLTSGLYQALAPSRRNIITHAPQTPYWYPDGGYGAAYQQIWQQVGNQIAWFNQFYSNADYDATPQLKVQSYEQIAAITGPQKLLVGAPLTSSVEGYIPLEDMIQNESVIFMSSTRAPITMVSFGSMISMA